MTRYVLMMVHMLGGDVVVSQQGYSSKESCERAKMAYRELLLTVPSGLDVKMRADKAARCVPE